MSNSSSKTLTKTEEKGLADLKAKLSEESLADEVNVRAVYVSRIK